MGARSAILELVMVSLLTLFIAASGFAVEKTAYQMTKDFEAEMPGDCALEYYYYVPCPTCSYFYRWTGWAYGDIVGQLFMIGDASMGGGEACDPATCHRLEEIRWLDLNPDAPGWYPTDYMIRFDLFCSDMQGCPIGPSFWSATTLSARTGWNGHTVLNPPCVGACIADPPGVPVILLTATHIGWTDGTAPHWGTDAPGKYVQYGSDMHEIGCLPVRYPRPWNSYYSPGIRSGYYGRGTLTCPPQYFCDKLDTTSDCTEFGFCELAWTITLSCSGPTSAEPATWGRLKSMYR